MEIEGNIVLIPSRPYHGSCGSSGISTPGILIPVAARPAHTAERMARTIEAILFGASASFRLDGASGAVRAMSLPQSVRR